jgi:hypothetical protein
MTYEGVSEVDHWRLDTTMDLARVNDAKLPYLRQRGQKTTTFGLGDT